MSDAAIYAAFGKAVSVRRKELGLTQEALSAQVGMSRASIANIESGRQNVLLHHVYSLAAALKFAKVSELLPTPPKDQSSGDTDMPISGSVTAREKILLNDLITAAMGSRGSARPGS